MNFTFEALIQIRNNSIQAIEQLSEHQLTKIPNGFNNNILWNLGHMVATQQILCYKLAGAPMLIEEDFINSFKKGSSPKDWNKQYTLNEIKLLIEKSNQAFKKDYNSGLLNNYVAYKTSSGVVLSSIEDAILYNYGHENLHYGILLTLKKLV